MVNLPSGSSDPPLRSERALISHSEGDVPSDEENHSRVVASGAEGFASSEPTDAEGRRRRIGCRKLLVPAPSGVAQEQGSAPTSPLDTKRSTPVATVATTGNAPTRNRSQGDVSVAYSAASSSSNLHHVGGGVHRRSGSATSMTSGTLSMVKPDSFYVYSSEDSSDELHLNAARSTSTIPLAASSTTSATAAQRAALSSRAATPTCVVAAAPPAVPASLPASAGSHHRSTTPVAAYFHDSAAALTLLQQYENRRPRIAALLEQHAAALRKRVCANSAATGPRLRAKSRRWCSDILQVDSEEQEAYETLRRDPVVMKRRRIELWIFLGVALVTFATLASFLARVEGNEDDGLLALGSPDASLSFTGSEASAGGARHPSNDDNDVKGWNFIVRDIVIFITVVGTLMTYNIRRLMS